MASDGHNKMVVESFYEALSDGDTEAVVAALASDLEYWFHGPPRCQHMMRVLTGEADHRGFTFAPRRVAELSTGWVVAEGWEGEGAYWVHVWAIERGVITQFREYFNTDVVVRDLGPAAATAAVGCGGGGGWGGPTLWESEKRGRVGRSLPGLVLAV